MQQKPDTYGNKTKQLIQTAEINILRTIVSKSKVDRVRNQTIIEQCKYCTPCRIMRKGLNIDTSGPTESRLMRKAVNEIGQSKLDRGRSRKR